MYRTIISFKTLFCFLLFVSPFVEFVIPGGDMYLACVVGVVAFVGVGLEAKGRQILLSSLLPMFSFGFVGGMQ